MSAEEYPTIGFDPAPGKLSSIDDLTDKLSKTVDGLKKAHDVLTGIGKDGEKGVWEGEAATAFSQKVGELPKYLDDSHDALHTAETQLKNWRTKLAQYQEKARRYEAEAKAAKSRETTAESNHEKATTAYNTAAADPALRLAGRPVVGQAALEDAQSRYDAAADRLRTAGQALDTAAGKVTAARDDLEAVIKKAKDLLEDHQEYARMIAGRLRKANDKAPDPGFSEGIGDAFKKLGNAIQEWCAEHADLLKEIGGANVSATDLIGDAVGVIPFGKIGKVALTGVKVPMKLYKVEGQTVASIDRVNKIRGLQNAGHGSVGLETGLFGRSVPPGSKEFGVSGLALGDRMKLAWDNHVLDTVGSSGKERAMSWVIDKVAPQRLKDSLGDAIRADGTLDPNSWWSRGPQMAQQAPSVALGAYNMFTGSEAPAAGRL